MTHIHGGSMHRIPILIFCALLFATSCTPTGAQPGSNPTAPGQSVSQQGTPKRLTIAVRSDPKALAAKLNSAAGAGGAPGADEIEQMRNNGLAVRAEHE